jgi:voltage-gated potassium channel
MKDLIAMLKLYGLLRKLIIAVSILLSVFFIGIAGYIFIEDYSLLNAIYMTIITMASVGFSEVHPLSDYGKIFTSGLILASIVAYVYFITLVTSFIIEGEFRTYFKHLRVNKEIQQLKDHVVVCGFGRNGKQACQQLASGNVKYVVVENNQHIIDAFKEEANILFVDGNATEDEVLNNAGIKNAKGLIAALPDDASNVFVVLTARELNPTMKIISRASTDAAENKLRRAGADNVIMPDKIGGTHMAALITKPDVLEFIDFITGKINITLEEINYNHLKNQYKDNPISQMNVHKSTGANVIGFKNAKGEYNVNPNETTLVTKDSKLFVLGTNEQISHLNSIIKN